MPFAAATLLNRRLYVPVGGETGVAIQGAAYIGFVSKGPAMSNVRFTVADVARLQVENLPKPEQTALRAFFSGPRAIGESKVMDGGNFVARLGTRRVLWRQDDRGRPVILGVLDQSYAARA